MTLQDLDGDEDPTDSVNVTIEAVGTDSYRAISTGTYGASKRKVEAIFEMTAGAGSTPAFYTKSDIKIKKRVTIRGVSLFSENDILIESFDTPPGGQPPFYYFKRSYEEPNGFSKDALNIDNSVADELGDWDISPWNTIGRKGVTPYSLPTPSLPYTTTSVPFEGVGFGAEGKICGSSSCQSEHPSVADGVYGYDSTTGTKGNRLTFVDKPRRTRRTKIPTLSPTPSIAPYRIPCVSGSWPNSKATTAVNFRVAALLNGILTFLSRRQVSPK